jgi:hypothetical protein
MFPNQMLARLGSFLTHSLSGNTLSPDGPRAATIALMKQMEETMAESLVDMVNETFPGGILSEVLNVPPVVFPPSGRNYDPRLAEQALCSLAQEIRDFDWYSVIDDGCPFDDPTIADLVRLATAHFGDFDAEQRRLRTAKKVVDAVGTELDRLFALPGVRQSNFRTLRQRIAAAKASVDEQLGWKVDDIPAAATFVIHVAGCEKDVRRFVDSFTQHIDRDVRRRFPHLRNFGAGPFGRLSFHALIVGEEIDCGTVALPMPEAIREPCTCQVKQFVGHIISRLDELGNYAGLAHELRGLRDALPHAASPFKGRGCDALLRTVLGDLRGDIGREKVPANFVALGEMLDAVEKALDEVAQWEPAEIPHAARQVFLPIQGTYAQVRQVLELLQAARNRVVEEQARIAAEQYGLEVFKDGAGTLCYRTPAETPEQLADTSEQAEPVGAGTAG